MKYGDLIQCNPIESVVRLRDADNQAPCVAWWALMSFQRLAIRSTAAMARLMR